MQITVVREAWDNNSICLDVYGKFIYMAQFSANFPVEKEKQFLVPFFQEYFMEIVKTGTLFCCHCLAKGNSKGDICVYVVKKELIIVCGLFLP